MDLVKNPPKIDFVNIVQENPGIFSNLNHPDLHTIIQQANDRYLHWDKFRWHKLPDVLPQEVVWAYLHFTRRMNRRPMMLADTSGKHFSYWSPDRVLQILSELDRWSGETIMTNQPGGLPLNERYIISSLMEEAIASSQLEGAATTRQVAKDMLRSGRKPRNNNEKMIYNNWITMQYLREHKESQLTPEFLCQIHELITHQTLDDDADAGRIRTRDDIVVMYREEQVHKPPLASALPERLEALCYFANVDDEHQWIHPIVKAIMLHFWIAYDHPFVDGNGRTARAVFYWYLLSRNYWLFEYLAVSRYFLRAPSQYARAYLYTETDDGDLTYFLMYNLRAIQAAFKDLRHHLARKQQQLADAQDLLTRYRDLNVRQRNIIAHMLRHPNAEFTIQAHKNVNNVAYDTARTDLQDLAERGLLYSVKRGKTHIFVASEQLIEHLRR